MSGVERVGTMDMAGWIWTCGTERVVEFLLSSSDGLGEKVEGVHSATYSKALKCERVGWKICAVGFDRKIRILMGTQRTGTQEEMSWEDETSFSIPIKRCHLPSVTIYKQLSPSVTT